MKALPIGALLDELTKGLSESDVQEIDNLSTISSEITAKRLEMGMSQKEFAKYMGVTQAMVSKWESGNYNFALSPIRKESK